ncbi:MAG: TlpA disulfide reductase family protein [Bryobacteraceae bacterium]|jgi:peroxiredoxin
MSKRRFLAPALALLLVTAPAVEAINVPRKSPELAINLNDGKQVLLSQYQGKVVVVAFILTWCTHCQKTIGYLSKDQNAYGPRGFQVLASAIEDLARTNLPAFIRQFNPPFPVGFDNQTVAINYLEHPPMLIPHMPILAFIDRQGIIRAQYEGDDKFFSEDRQEKNLSDKIEELLKQGAAGSKKSVTKKSSAAPKKPS